MRIQSFSVFMVLLCTPFICNAQDTDDTGNIGRLDFRLGLQAFSKFSTGLRIDSDTLGLGTEFELEQDLAVEESIQVARLDGVFRINARHALAMSFYDINRDGSRATTRDIDYGDASFPAGTPVASTFDQQILKLAYRYRFVSKPRAEFAGSFGLHTMRIESSLRALDGSIVQEVDDAAPLPVFGVHGTYQISDKWSFVGTLEWFDIQAGDFKGTFLDALVAVEHDTFENIGFGFGINRFRFDVEAGDENLRGRIDLTFDAALLYFTGSFGSVN